MFPLVSGYKWMLDMYHTIQSVSSWTQWSTCVFLVYFFILCSYMFVHEESRFGFLEYIRVSISIFSWFFFILQVKNSWRIFLISIQYCITLNKEENQTADVLSLFIIKIKHTVRCFWFGRVIGYTGETRDIEYICTVLDQSFP